MYHKDTNNRARNIFFVCNKIKNSVDGGGLLLLLYFCV